jgi:nucleoid-associated protein YgaU
MAKSRYFDTPVIAAFRGSPEHYTTYNIPEKLRGYAEIDLLSGEHTVEHVMVRGERLDHLAAKHYGEDEYWWIIALANGIAYPLGIAPGTVIKIPLDVRSILEKLEMV